MDLKKNIGDFDHVIGWACKPESFILAWPKTHSLDNMTLCPSGQMNGKIYFVGVKLTKYIWTYPKIIPQDDFLVFEFRIIQLNVLRKWPM